MKKVMWCGLVTLWMLICALMTSADLHRGYVWYDSANRKGFETKGKSLLCLWCFAASTVSDLVVTGSVLAVSISKTLLKEKNLWAFLTSFSRKSGSSLQTFSYLVSPFTIWALCPGAGWFCSAHRAVCWEPWEEKWYLQSSISVQDLP